MSELTKDWDQFKDLLHKKSGIDLNLYKENQMQRRISNFMQRNNAKNFVELFKIVTADEKLYRTFIEFLTINVTEFFRTPEKFVELENIVIPDLLKTSSRLKIWSAGCSIGAEPYSIAMALNELTPKVKHTIIASDLDVEILNKAKAARYTANEIKNISADRVKKYFVQTGTHYQLSEDIKKLVEFRHQNLLRDKFDTGFNLILCRNVVIYFTEEAKNELYSNFLKALKPGGILFVGGTEAILNFAQIGYKQYRPFFYQKPL